jgi:hypothetical protein
VERGRWGAMSKSASRRCCSALVVVMPIRQRAVAAGGHRPWAPWAAGLIMALAQCSMAMPSQEPTDGLAPMPQRPALLVTPAPSAPAPAPSDKHEHKHDRHRFRPLSTGQLFGPANWRRQEQSKSDADRTKPAGLLSGPFLAAGPSKANGRPPMRGERAPSAGLGVAKFENQASIHGDQTSSTPGRLAKRERETEAAAAATTTTTSTPPLAAKEKTKKRQQKKTRKIETKMSSKSNNDSDNYQQHHYNYNYNYNDNDNDNDNTFDLSEEGKCFLIGSKRGSSATAPARLCWVLRDRGGRCSIEFQLADEANLIISLSPGRRQANRFSVRTSRRRPATRSLVHVTRSQPASERAGAAKRNGYRTSGSTNNSRLFDLPRVSLIRVARRVSPRLVI